MLTEDGWVLASSEDGMVNQSVSWLQLGLKGTLDTIWRQGDGSLLAICLT